MKKQTVILSICALLLSVGTISCKKYLDAKSNKSLRTLDTLEDMQAVMDMQTVMNGRGEALSILCADEFYVTTSVWSAWPLEFRLNYIWDKDAERDDYNVIYQVVAHANIVLGGLENVKFNEIERNTYNSIKGQALFHRSFAFYQAAQLFCKPYSTSASSDPGIALKMNNDVEELSKRATVQQTYDQIIHDLKLAAALLPVKSFSLTTLPSRPSKIAAFAALSRTYLSMRKYNEASLYADSCLLLNNNLLDYNQAINNSPPFNPDTNPELIFYCIPFYGSGGLDKLFDTAFYQSYANNDLRKVLYFRQNANGYGIPSHGNYGWPRSYDFTGLANDEVFLTKAECFARAGNKDSAMAYLNSLLVKRWRTGTFIPMTANDAADALNKVLNERRKELLLRGTRWTDLRRLNLEGRNISLSRPQINGVTYTLPANDLRWVLLFPREVINLSQVTQNPR